MKKYAMYIDWISYYVGSYWFDKIGAAFSIVELVWKPIQYYIHERV
jgi:uncharacterized membrane protein